MKTTIDIPEALSKKPKTRAIERGETLKQLVLTPLERELAISAPSAIAWANRKILPEFSRLQAAGAFCPNPGARDITALISEDRDDCV